MALRLECAPCRAGDVKKSRKQLAREAEAGPAAKGSVVPVPAPDSHALETHSQPAAAANSGGSPMAQHAGGCNLTWKPTIALRCAGCPLTVVCTAAELSPQAQLQAALPGGPLESNVLCASRPLLPTALCCRRQWRASVARSPHALCAMLQMAAQRLLLTPSPRTLYLRGPRMRSTTPCCSSRMRGWATWSSPCMMQHWTSSLPRCDSVSAGCWAYTVLKHYLSCCCAHKCWACPWPGG